jgi:dUTP pyrophosphatase
LNRKEPKKIKIVLVKGELMSELKLIEVETVADSLESLPTYGTELAAGADVRANVSTQIILEAGDSILVPTGLKFAIPEGYEIQVRPRSGLALKHQVTVLNTPGTIDADYRGELQVILINHGKRPFVIEPQMRIAQIVLTAVCKASFVLSQELGETKRGVCGFGHTGL